MYNVYSFYLKNTEFPMKFSLYISAFLTHFCRSSAFKVLSPLFNNATVYFVNIREL